MNVHTTIPVTRPEGRTNAATNNYFNTIVQLSEEYAAQNAYAGEVSPAAQEELMKPAQKSYNIEQCAKIVRDADLTKPCVHK